MKDKTKYQPHNNKLRNPKERYTTKNTLNRHTTLKLLIIKDKEKNLKGNHKKDGNNKYRATKIKMTTYCFHQKLCRPETMKWCLQSTIIKPLCQKLFT